MDYFGLVHDLRQHLIMLIDQYDPSCFGRSWSAGWVTDGTSLAFTNAVSDATQTCAPLDVEQAWTTAVFGSRPWQRVT